MSSPQVLVVGAGPTGLMLATELLRKGVSVRIIDQVEFVPLKEIILISICNIRSNM